MLQITVLSAVIKMSTHLFSQIKKHYAKCNKALLNIAIITIS